MAYTTNQLVTNAFYLSGVVSRDFQTVTGDQISNGLQLLNELLDLKTADNNYIPYYTKYPFNAIVGQESYFIPNLVSIETFTFNIGPVRYSVRGVERKDYQGDTRVDNINSLPYKWYYEKCLNGANFYIYFLPDQAYPSIIWGKFSLADVALGQDLSLTLDKFYIGYLRYLLAEYICQDYQSDFPQGSDTKLKEYERIIANLSTPDITLQKVSTLSQGQSLNFGTVNLGPWVPA